MRILYSAIIVGVLVGLVWGVSAQAQSSELLGDWRGYNHPCSPCLIHITDIKEDGQLVLRFEIGTDRTEAWGRVTHAGKRAGVNITTAGGHQLDLELSKNGKRLQGLFTLEGRPESGIHVTCPGACAHPHHSTQCRTLRTTDQRGDGGTAFLPNTQ